MNKIQLTVFAIYATKQALLKPIIGINFVYQD